MKKACKDFFQAHILCEIAQSFDKHFCQCLMKYFVILSNSDEGRGKLTL